MIISELYQYNADTSIANINSYEIINFKNGALLYNDASATIYINGATTKINKTNINILDACSNGVTSYMLCSSATDTFILTYSQDDGLNYFNISMVNSTNGTIYFKENVYAYIGKEIYSINTNDRNTVIQKVSVTANNYYKASVVNIIKTGTESSKFYIYDKDIIVPSVGIYTKYNINAPIVSSSNNLIPSSIHSITQVGEKNDYSEPGIISIIVSGTSIYVCDNMDLTEYVIAEFNSTPTVLHVNDSVYIFGDGNMYLLNNKDYELDRLYIDELDDATTFSVERYLYTTKLLKATATTTYSIDKYVGEVVAINVICVNTEHTIINLSHYVVPKNATKIIPAPVVEGYTPVNDSTTVVCNTDKDVPMAYTYTSSLASVTVNHKCGNDILSSYVIKGIPGAEYLFEPVVISGYIHFKSINASGVFGENTECTIEYVPINTTVDLFTTVVKINVFVGEKYMMAKYLEVDKNTPRINCPMFHGLTPESPTIDINHDYSFTTVNVKCTLEPDVDKVYRFIYECEDKTLYESVGYIQNGRVYTEDVSAFLSHSEITPYDINENTFTILECTPVSNITVYSISNSLPLYSYCKFSNSDLYIPSIENNLFADYSIAQSNKIKVYSFKYEQQLFNIHVYHKIGSATQHEEIYTGHVNDTQVINHLDIPGYECKDKTNHIYGPTDKLIVYNYVEKNVSINIFIRNLNGSIVKSSNYMFGINDTKKITVDISDKYNVLYKDTLVNEEVTITATSSIDLNYVVYEKYTHHTWHTYESNSAILHVTLDNPFCFPVASSVITGNNVYVLCSETVDNSSTLQYLTNNSIAYTVVVENDIESLPSGSIIVNGDITSKKLIANISCSDKIVLPMNISYVSLKNTITRAKSNCIRAVLNAPGSSIDAEVSINDIKYNKVNNKVYIELDINQSFNDSSMNIPIDVYDIRENVNRVSYNYSVRTSTNIDKCMYIIDDKPVTSIPNTATVNDVTNISSVVKLDSTNILEKYLHIILFDKLGNMTEQKDIFISYRVTESTTLNSFSNKVMSSSGIRYNNRYRGPRESYKIYNTYSAIDRDIATIDKCIENIIKKVGDFNE